MVFVSHAWNEGQPDPQVLEFVDFLRNNGYEAICDVMLQQSKTSIHFTEMMADSMRKAKKIIIVLSQNYKNKADNFVGGVGTEYRYVIEDFVANENKYILVSFTGRSPEIIPDFLRGRDIVDLSVDRGNEYRELFSKLSDVLKYQFAPVAPRKTVPSTKKISDFSDIKERYSVSPKNNIDFSSFGNTFTDMDKKKYLRKSYRDIITSLCDISREFCERYTFFHIECDEVDNNTNTLEIYKNGRKIHSIQIWYGDFLGGGYRIFIANGIGNKNSFSEMIDCQVNNGLPLLHFNMGMFNKDATVAEVTKHIWDQFISLYLKIE